MYANICIAPLQPAKYLHASTFKKADLEGKSAIQHASENIPFIQKQINAKVTPQK